MTNSTKAKLNEAFKAMRKAGLVARQNFGRTRSTGEDLGRSIEDLPKSRRAKILGGAYYLVQDSNSKYLYVSYGAAPGCPNSKSDLEVGNMVAKALKDAGLEIIWNGSPDINIEVVLAS